MTPLLPAPPPFPAPRAVDALARRALRELLRRLGDGELVVVEPDGDETSFGRRHGYDTLAATVRVHTAAAYTAALGGGSIGLADSYVNGWWDTDDLVSLLRIATRALPGPGSLLARIAPLRSRARRRAPVADSRAQAREDIAAHYDLGNDFFATFLDPTLSYSCALFSPPELSLEEASVAKLDRICHLLELRPGMDLLEIGTGWGGFALHAAERYGCSVTTTTLSRRQHEYVQALVASRGLNGQITVLNEDYRDLTGSFDAVASIEMLEALSWRQYRDYFARVRARLRPGAKMALQTIVIDERVYPRARHAEDFIKARIFPGSCIPSVGAVLDAAAAADLRMTHLTDIGAHYAETLRRWRERFAKNEARIAALGFDERFRRLWDLYLAYCEAGFLERRISDVQVVLEHPGASAGGGR